MNKRIRKKHLKRALNGLLAAYDEYEAARERVFRKALQGVIDARGKSHEEYVEAIRCFMEVISILARRGPPLRSLTE